MAEATTRINALSLHDALPIWVESEDGLKVGRDVAPHLGPMLNLERIQAVLVDAHDLVGGAERGHDLGGRGREAHDAVFPDRKSTRLNSSHLVTSYAVFCL